MSPTEKYHSDLDIDECISDRCGYDSLCQNYQGGFDCECKVAGNFKASVTGKCTRKCDYYLNLK